MPSKKQIKWRKKFGKASKSCSKEKTRIQKNKCVKKKLKKYPIRNFEGKLRDRC